MTGGRAGGPAPGDVPAGDVDGPILGIETSCDECSAAVLAGGRLRGHVIASQDAHAAFGGVVPEIAARAHLRQLDRVVAAALSEAAVGRDGVEAVGVTAGPGLIGSLLVGVNWAKAFAFRRGIAVLGVHHMEAHLFANAVEDPDARPPFVALLVSGGHTLLLHCPAWGTYRLLGATRDDAAGEAFDKSARRLGLGYPGGPEIERVARGGTPGRFELPRPMLSPRDGPADPGWFDFSFSGLKTAVVVLARRLEASEELEDAVPDVAAEFQEAVVDVLVTKTLRAVEATGCGRVVVGGGVARNTLLRERLAAVLGDESRLHVPPPRLATDNAAMVAKLAAFRLGRGERSGLDLTADASLPFPGLSERTSPAPASA